MPAEVSAKVTGPTWSRKAWVTNPVPAPYSNIRIAVLSGIALLIALAMALARSMFAASSQVAALSSKLVELMNILSRAKPQYPPGNHHQGLAAQ
jgi:hypothetical protein